VSTARNTASVKADNGVTTRGSIVRDAISLLRCGEETLNKRGDSDWLRMVKELECLFLLVVFR